MFREQNIASILEITDSEFHDLVSFVYSSYGIDLSRKRKLIEGRLSNTLKAKNFSSFSDYITFLHNDKTGDELRNFLNRITTNYSYFARENDHFKYLFEAVLPFWEKRCNRDLRTWSAGCSSGQEPYNIAMTYDQYFGIDKLGIDKTILATDISTNVLTLAKEGVYPEKDLAGLPTDWKQKYFSKISDGLFQLSPKIRKEVEFRIFNLMNDFVYKKQFHIIFCRNVMIYFDSKTTQRIIEKFYDALAPGGYLFIGHSESIDRRNTKFRYVHPAVYQKPF